MSFAINNQFNNFAIYYHTVPSSLINSMSFSGGGFVSTCLNHQYKQKAATMTTTGAHPNKIFQEKCFSKLAKSEVGSVVGGKACVLKIIKSSWSAVYSYRTLHNFTVTVEIKIVLTL